MKSLSNPQKIKKNKDIIMDNNQWTNIEQEVSSLHTKVTLINSLVDRLETTIVKASDIMNQMDRLVTTLDMKIQYQETRQTNMENDIKELRVQLAKTKAELLEKINKNENKLLLYAGAIGAIVAIVLKYGVATFM